MLYRLCLYLGCTHPDNLGDILTVSQLRGWIRYSQIEPFGPLADRVYAGSQVAAAYNVHSKDKTLTWEDIFPPFKAKPKDEAMTLERWAELSLEERTARWAKMEQEEREEFLRQEAEAVKSYMNARMIESDDSSSQKT